VRCRRCRAWPLVERDVADATVHGQDAGLRPDLLGGEDPLDWREQRVTVEQFQVPGELLDAHLAAVVRIAVYARLSRNPSGRPDFQGLIKFIKENKVDVIFATEVERLVRQPAEAEQLIDLAGVTNLREVHLTSDEGYDLSTPDGVYRIRQAVYLAERESRKTSERLRRKLADRARNGQTHGSRRCFGYKTGNMEIDEAEAFVLREMGAKLLANYSFKEIAYWANEQGYKTAEGKLWYPITIRNSLRRVRYAGIREHRGAQFPAAWPAVFDAPAWEHMQLRIKRSADRFADRPKARRYLLTGRVYCGKCGSSLNGETKRDHPGRPLRPVFDRLDPEKVVELLRDSEPSDGKLKQLLDQRAAQQLRLDGLVDDYASGLLDRAELARAKAKAQAELSTINTKIELLRTRMRQPGPLTVRDSLRQAWQANEDIGWRGTLIDMVVERIDVFPGIGKPFVDVDGVTMRFDKDRVLITWRKIDTLAA